MTDGVTPSVEVKRADLAEVTAPDDSGDNRQPTQPRTPNAPQTPGGNTPPVVVAPKPTDDLMLKKAIEVLSSGVKVKRKAA
jgi:hypothetical protein